MPVKSLFFAISLLVSASAAASVVKIPGSTGVLINHTSLPPEAFKVSYSVRCQSTTGVSCGSFELEQNLNAFGIYTIPDFELEVGTTRPQDRRYSLFVFLSLPTEDARFPKGVAPGDLAQLTDKRKISSLAELKAPDFSLFRAEPGVLDIRLQSGRDLNEFLKNEGRDVGVTVELDFGLSGTNNLDTTVRLEQTGFSRKRWVDLRETYMLLPGKLATDAAIDYVVTYEYQTVKSGRLNFAPNLVGLLGALTIDDTAARTEQLPLERKLTGEFADTNFHLDYALRDRMKFDEIGFSYATLKAECVNGQIQGELIYREGQFTDEPETSRVPVSGVCQGETGTLQWPIENISGQTEMLSAKYARIRAQTYEKPNGTKSIGRLLFTDDISESQGIYKGKELSMFLTVRLADGTYAGHISVGTDN